jgi:hypothetical protein
MCVTCNSYLCSDEPHLADVLDDPMIQAVMTRDGIGRSEMVDLVHAVQQKLARQAENSTRSLQK